MKLDFNFDGKTLLKKWWQQVKSNFQTVQDEYNTLEDNLSEEINQASNCRCNCRTDLEGTELYSEGIDSQ